MTDIYALSDPAILAQIGQKLKEARIEQNISQKSLADSSGLSTFSISQMENGHNTSLLSLIMVLRALNRLDVFEGLFREKPVSPVALSKYMKKNPQRQHAYSMNPTAEKGGEITSDFNWDEDKQ
jgi:transcriptional regulator with XRE-family HTH domain